MSANKRPFILGLTGGIASGKSEAGKKLRELGAFIIDADALSRAQTAPGGPALGPIRERFGDGVFHADGTLDRRALGARVFTDVQERRALEMIIHPAAQREMYKLIDEARDQGAAVCVLMVPLLYETAMDAICDEVWVTSVEREEQIRRIMQRDRLTSQEAAARIDSQMPDAEREQRANLVIRTGRPIEQTQKDIKKQYEALLRRIG